MHVESSLTPAEHGLINKRPEHFPGGAIKYQEFVQSLLEKYASNPTALDHIAVYTSDPEYVDKVHAYKTALLLRDSEKIAELETWFKKNYPSLFIEWTSVPQKKEAQSSLLRIIQKIFGIR